MSLYLYDHNVMKPYRINDRERREWRHAQVAGLSPGALERLVEGFFDRRFFVPRRLVLSESSRMTLGRQWVTPLKRNPEVKRKYLAA